MVKLSEYPEFFLVFVGPTQSTYKGKPKVYISSTQGEATNILKINAVYN
jgi:hypothetical protein